MLPALPYSWCYCLSLKLFKLCLFCLHFFGRRPKGHYRYFESIKSMTEKFGDCVHQIKDCDFYYNAPWCLATSPGHSDFVTWPSPSQCWIRQHPNPAILSHPQFPELGVTANPHTLLFSPHLHRAIFHLYFHLFSVNTVLVYK